MPHQIRTSARRSFRGCRRRWRWNVVQGYVPLETPKPLEFGSALHVGLQHFYDPESWDHTSVDYKLGFAETAFELECERQRKAYLDETGEIRLNYEQEDDYSARISLGKSMFQYYAYEIHAKKDFWFKPVRVEQEFEVPIGDGSLTCSQSPECGQEHENPSEVVYAGRIDMLVEDLDYGGYFVWDHKSAETLSPDDDFLFLDDQVASYTWATGRQLGLDVRGFVYAEWRKAVPSEPRELSRRYRGCKFSQDRSAPHEYESYLHVVSELDRGAFDAGLYDEMLEYLRSDEAPRFYKRWPVVKTERELDEIGKNIELEAADMIDPELRVYPSVGRFTCKSCAYRQPCAGMFRGDNVQFTLDTMFKRVK